MSFNIGLSGLRGAQTDLSVTGNNIANASTTGFKQSRAEFGDVYNASILGTGRHSIGSGVLTERISQQHTQGNVNYTDRALDLAINGNGYFILSNEGQREYTRAGYFDLDKDGFITNNTGKRLQGYEASLQGDIQSGALGDIQLSQTNIQPRATSQIEMELNLDSRSEVGTGASLATFNVPFTENAPVAGDSFTVEIPDGSGQNVTVNYDGTNWNVDGGNDTLTVDGETFTATVSGGNIRLTAANARAIDSTLAPDYTVAGTGVNGAAAVGFDATSFTNGTTGNWDIANFDPRDRATYTDANSTSIYDSLGNEHVLRQYYIKVDRDNNAEGNAWAVLTSLNGTFIDSEGQSSGFTEENWAGATAANKYDMVQATKFFNVQGDLQGVKSYDSNGDYQADQMGGVTLGGVGATAFELTVEGITPGSGFGSNVAGEPPDFNDMINFRFRGTTQYGARFAVQSQSQDGYTTGRLAGLEVDQEGIIFGRYTNGQNRPIGQVPIATFTNPEGLRPKGSTAWLETTESGLPAINQAGAGITGNIEGGALEESNVDLSEELVKMIIAQRNYQANAKTIQTQDTLTQTIINLR